MALSPFRNEASLDFTVPVNRSEFADALGRVRGGLGRDYPPLIGGERVETRDRGALTSPRLLPIIQVRKKLPRDEKVAGDEDQGSRASVDPIH